MKFRILFEFYKKSFMQIACPMIAQLVKISSFIVKNIIMIRTHSWVDWCKNSTLCYININITSSDNDIVT